MIPDVWSSPPTPRASLDAPSSTPHASRNRTPRSTPLPPLVIGVAGGSASGKTTVVEAVVEALGPDRVARLQHDAYYRGRGHLPLAERARLNYDHPDALETELLVDHLQALKEGRSVEIPVYDFTRHARTGDTVTVHPRRAVIVEGILILAEQTLRELLDIRVYVDADADLRVLRRLRRDLRERGRDLDSVVTQYLETVRPMHLEFVEPSKRHAHVIVPGGGRNRVAVDMLIAKIRAIVDQDEGPPTG